MASKDFVEFMSTYLPEHPELKKRIEDITDPMEFVKTAIAEGNSAGFPFNEVDVDTVLHASLADQLELSKEQLEAVVGGAGVGFSVAPIPVVQIKNLASAGPAIQLYNGGDTVMCCLYCNGEDGHH